jgi:hypothetical protein
MSADGGPQPERASGERLQDFARRFMGEWAGRSLAPDDLVDFAARAVPNAVGAGLTLVRRDRRPMTLAASNDLAARVDAIENETGEGPCLDAIEHDDINVVQDLELDHRWPTFNQRAVRETPVRSMLGVRIYLSGDDRGALNLYGKERGAFTDLDVGVAAMMSALSSLSLQGAMEQRRADHLEVALESSRLIGMAMGVLMSSRLLTADQAFEALRRASQHTGRKLRDIAREVTDTGVLVDPPERTDRRQ